jgi:two-component SAPR family response regulator
MHFKNTKPNILCLTKDEFSKSLRELKDYLDFNLFFSSNLFVDISDHNYQAILMEPDNFDNATIELINNISHKGKILLCDENKFNNINHDCKMTFPISLSELNRLMINVITGKNFAKNSSLDIKEYLLDKNEKKLKKDKLHIVLTEKEIQLIELLFNEPKPIRKKKILELIWKYSASADTHTVETHIYRLRKKITKKFNDEKFIINDDQGYSI